MGKGSCNSCIPKLLLLCHFFNSSVYVINGGHDKGSEVLCLEDDNIVIIPLALVVVIVSGEQVGLLVESTWLVLKYEVVFSKLGDPVHLSSVQLLQ